MGKDYKQNYKNPISRALASYREDFYYNWDWYKRNITKFNEYLLIHYKNGEIETISDGEWFEEHSFLPRYNASKILYVTRFWGCGSETITAKDIELETSTIHLFDKEGNKYFTMYLEEDEVKEMHRQMNEAFDVDNEMTDGCLFCLDYCRRLAKENPQRNRYNPENDSWRKTRK